MVRGAQGWIVNVVVRLVKMASRKFQEEGERKENKGPKIQG